MCMSCLRPPNVSLSESEGVESSKDSGHTPCVPQAWPLGLAWSTPCTRSLNSVSANTLSYIYAFYCYSTMCEKGEVTDNHVDYMAHGFPPVGVYECQDFDPWSRWMVPAPPFSLKRTFSGGSGVHQCGSWGGVHFPQCVCWSFVILLSLLTFISSLVWAFFLHWVFLPFLHYIAAFWNFPNALVLVAGCTTWRQGFCIFFSFWARSSLQIENFCHSCHSLPVIGVGHFQFHQQQSVAMGLYFC